MSPSSFLRPLGGLTPLLWAKQFRSTCTTGVHGMVQQLSPMQMGLAAGLLGAFFLGLMGFLVHLAATSYPSQQLLFFRALIGLALLLPSHWNRLPVFFSPAYGGLWLRALTGSGSVMILFYNLGQLGAASATLLLDMSVLYLVALSWWFGGERFKGLEWLCVGLIFVGNVLLNVSGNPIPGFNLALGLFGALMAAISFVVLRQVSQKHKASDILLVYVLTILLLTLLIPGPSWTAPGPETAWVLLAVGLASTCNQLLVTETFARIKAPVAGSLALTGVLWAGLMDYWWLGVGFTPVELLAYGLILGAVGLLKLSRA